MERLALEELLEYEDSVLQSASDEFTYKSSDGDRQFNPDFVLKGGGGSDPVAHATPGNQGEPMEGRSRGSDS